MNLFTRFNHNLYLNFCDSNDIKWIFKINVVVGEVRKSEKSESPQDKAPEKRGEASSGLFGLIKHFLIKIKYLPLHPR